MVILADYSGGAGFSADGQQAGHVPGGLRLYVQGPLLPGLVRRVPLTRSQIAFILGVFGAMVMTRSPAALTTSPDAVVKTRSRSWIRNLSVPVPSPGSMARLRAGMMWVMSGGCTTGSGRRT